MDTGQRARYEKAWELFSPDSLCFLPFLLILRLDPLLSLLSLPPRPSAFGPLSFSPFLCCFLSPLSTFLFFFFSCFLLLLFFFCSPTFNSSLVFSFSLFLPLFHFFFFLPCSFSSFSSAPSSFLRYYILLFVFFFFHAPFSSP